MWTNSICPQVRPLWNGEAWSFWRCWKKCRLRIEWPPRALEIEAPMVSPMEVSEIFCTGFFWAVYWDYCNKLLCELWKKYRTVQVAKTPWVLLASSPYNWCFRSYYWSWLYGILYVAERFILFGNWLCTKWPWMRWTPAAMLGRNLAGDRAKFPEAPTRAQSRADEQRCEALFWVLQNFWYQNGTRYESRHWPLESEDFLSAYIMIYCEDV